MEIDDCIKYHRISLEFEITDVERAVVEKTITILERVKLLETYLKTELGLLETAWKDGDEDPYYGAQIDLVEEIQELMGWKKP